LTLLSKLTYISGENPHELLVRTSSAIFTERFFDMGHRRERVVILAALFTALSVALGFLLAGLPNVELMTLTVFMAGLFCGARLGTAVGGISILMYSLLNPLGPAPAPLLAAQVAGFIVIGASGGIVGPRIKTARASSIAAGAAAGFVLTLVYDILTTIASAFIVLGADRFVEGLGGIFLAGALFIAWHVGINTAVFGAAVLPIMRAVRAWQAGEAA
jgi:hypothetical protein